MGGGDPARRAPPWGRQGGWCPAGRAPPAEVTRRPLTERGGRSDRLRYPAKSLVNSDADSGYWVMIEASASKYTWKATLLAGLSTTLAT